MTKFRGSTVLVLFLGLFLTVHESNSQLFRQVSSRPRPQPRPARTACLFRKYCEPSTTPEPEWWTSSTTTTTEWTPPVTEDDFQLPPFRRESTKQVDLLSIAESCAANFITQDYQEGWEERLETFGGDGKYWPVRLTNKLFVYLMAFNMYETNGLSITETQLEESPCFLTTMVNGWGITNTTGFNGKSALLRLSRTNLPKVYRFSLPYGPVGASAGTASIILSDNRSWNVFEFCFDNGFRTFAMFARNIADGDISAVKLHLKAIGFQEKQMIDLNPDLNCDISDGDRTGVFYPRTSLPYSTSQNKNYVRFIENNALLPLPPFFWKKK